MKTTDHLDALGQVLALHGISGRPRYDQEPARLRVFLPNTPRFGDSVNVGTGPDGEPWFISSTGAAMAPVWDLPCAAERIAGQLTAYLPLAQRLAVGKPIPRSRLRRLVEALIRPAM
ncbi:hypothetical protein SMC26_15970 [Actinomadura fulvescens]|uniref:Uncharacterized protein n=1 Tax=Actinomadura fulvescens TaxID=46160 RepID=A0ABN3QW72_9ACTN